MKKLWRLVGIVFAVASAATAFGQGSEDYKVYDAIVRHMFRDGITRFDMNAKIEQIVIRDRTHSNYAWSSSKENWEQVKIRLPGLTDDTIADYEAVRKSEEPLQTKLDIPFKYVLISDKQLGEIFRDTKDRSFDYWPSFYKNYPGSAGYNSFSRVGFDKAKQNALVYFVNWCGSLCGTGSYLHLKKGENGWSVKNAGGMWIS
ncbi:MAG: hypothetical protein QM785_04210 [Pyrinomonadaceae bacterium]